MMNTAKKINAFLSNAKLLNEGYGIKPLLYGSLGLEYLTGEDLNSEDIDILIPEVNLTSGFREFKELLESNGYILYDEHEHTFVKNEISYSYAKIEELGEFAKIREDEIEEYVKDGVIFKVLTLRQYLSVYEASSKDGYRVNIREKKEKEKIEFIKNRLAVEF